MSLRSPHSSLLRKQVWQRRRSRPLLKPGPELTLIIPTLNERDNIAPLLNRLKQALGPIDWEIIFVDDNSPDGTAQAARALSRQDRRVRVMRRIGRRGLSGACLEGILSASAPIVAVMDADMQHDESCLPKMLDILRNDQADMVVASRFAGSGEAAGGFSRFRHAGSRIGVAIARHLFDVEIRDPMSGFFMIHRQFVEDVAPKLSQQGFKILLDIVLSSRAPLRITEVPYQFRPRTSGESKLDSAVTFEYLGLLVAKLSGDLISIRFLLFALIGLTGLFVQLAILKASLGIGLSFPAAQTVAMSTAMVSNYFLNNLLTYRDRRRRGWRLILGLASFAGVCSLGLVAGVGASTLLYHHEPSWWLAGIAGAVIGAAWNYVASAAVVWRES